MANETPNAPAAGRPTIGGSLLVGETLEASVAGIADADGTPAIVAAREPGVRAERRRVRVFGRLSPVAAMERRVPERGRRAVRTGKRLLLLTLALLFPLLWNHADAQPTNSGSVATDRAALEALYHATDGPNWKTSTNWLSEEPLSAWHGVLLTTPSGRVRILSLHANRLHGPIPAEIANLTELELLNLTNNDLEGVLPTGLMKLTRLHTLWTGQVDLCAPRDPAFEAWLETIDFGGMLCPPQEQSVIDVAVFYTPAARDFAGGGAAEMESLIESMVAETNVAYAASGVNQRLSLVAAREVAHTEGDAPTDQERLVDRSDGTLDGVHAIRDEVAADVVMLLGDYDRGFADVMIQVSPDFEHRALGVASVSDVRWFAHELGHIMGLRHDRHLECHAGYCSPAAFEDGYGYVNQEAFEADAPDSARWYTIMAYGAQCVSDGLDCEPVLRFSNPDRLWPPGGGDPMGIPGIEHTGTILGPANAARALNRTRETVSQFRDNDDSGPDIDPDPPGKPDAPNVSAASASSLNVTWSAPDNAGPAITDYDVRYRAGTSGSWNDGNHAGTATTATLTGLAEGTSYDVQVRATNDEGTGDWSDSGTGTTDANAAPAFDNTMVVEGKEVILTYDRMLDESSVPAPEDFEVVIEGAPISGALSAGALRGKRYPASRGEPVSVIAVVVNGTEVRLTLDRPVAHGERVTVSYTPGTNPIRDTAGVAAPAIVDEVAVVETLVSVMDAAAVEGGIVVFDVTLSRAVEEALTVAWTLADGTAVAGDDYPAQSGSLTIPVDQDGGTVEVRTIDDSAAEGDETFTLTLAEPAGFPYWALLKDAMATGTIVDNDGGGGTGGGGSGGGAANRPPVVEREIEDQTLDAGEVLELDIRLNFYDRDQRALDYTAESADASVATVEVDRNGVLTIRGVSRGVTAITVTVADRRDERASDTFLVAVEGPALVALLPRASDPVREGFVRVINHAAEAGEVTIEAVDDTGMRLGPITLSVDAGATAHFNSGDLEDGNADKGLPTGVGSGEGDWRLVLDSDLDFEALSYIRTADGFLTAMHDTVPVRDGAYEVAIFNPGSNPNQVSGLRLVNLGAEDAQVTITGIDDAGVSPGSTVALTVPSGASRTIAAADLEAGADGFAGALGDGAGKWRLRVESDQPIVVMSLLSSPTGHLTNLSSAPDRRGN